MSDRVHIDTWRGNGLDHAVFEDYLRADCELYYMRGHNVYPVTPSGTIIMQAKVEGQPGDDAEGWIREAPGYAWGHTLGIINSNDILKYGNHSTGAMHLGGSDPAGPDGHEYRADIERSLLFEALFYPGSSEYNNSRFKWSVSYTSEAGDGKLCGGFGWGKYRGSAGRIHSLRVRAGEPNFSLGAGGVISLFGLLRPDAP